MAKFTLPKLPKIKPLPMIKMPAAPKAPKPAKEPKPQKPPAAKKSNLAAAMQKAVSRMPKAKLDQSPVKAAKFAKVPKLEK